MKFSIDLKALEGEKIQVLNYKKKQPEWELGTISLIEIRVRGNQTLTATYRVVLDRKAKKESYYSRIRGIVLYVGEDKIKTLN